MLLNRCLAPRSAGTEKRHKSFWALLCLRRCYQEDFSHGHGSLWVRFNVEESPWMSQTIFTSIQTGGGMLWGVTGSKKGLILKGLVLKDGEGISKAINKKAESWLAGWHIWVKTTTTIPVCMSGIRHSPGEKKGIEMEFEPSNCVFYLPFSVLLVQKEKNTKKQQPPPLSSCAKYFAFPNQWKWNSSFSFSPPHAKKDCEYINI